MTTELAKPDVFVEYRALVALADKKNPAPDAVSALRAYLRKHPEIVDLSGNMLDQVAFQMIQNTGSTQSVKEFVTAGMANVKRDAGKATATPLEGLLIDAIALAWLVLYIAQHRQANFMNSGGSIKEGEFLDKRVNAANRRYLQSIEALARVRKLATVTPAVFNIANQQVVNTGDGLR